MIKAVPTASTKTLFPRILFEDVHLLILSKPAGLLSQGEVTGEENLVDFLRKYLGRPYVGLIHRLDRNTSGLMVIAKRTKSAQRLTSALQQGEIHRSYLGWVEGNFPPEVFWKHFLEKDHKQNISTVVQSPIHTSHLTQSGSRSKAKEALLRAKTIRRIERDQVPLSLVEFTLDTGRSHQIRIQTAHEGWPIVGDPKYGHRRTSFLTSRMALHSYRLRLLHPMSKEVLFFEDPLPWDLDWEPNRSTRKTQPFK